ncbi:dicarboxylate/amino acid:cation symporter [Brevundimonas vitis]|uniref:Dicarboxylate/amino acid:cation symporter n=1 Tax=Brevundimonas vitisensis TaxID=2800818 RepID=A0ABX7BP97_9CAUL|nr:dicarboxylate/amino acid:cation symporter [Brevundimonas vitisensis]QQQ18678.1 dicarboxylate/amino acid:cation symporter [Brevundimonas vitisensis]
MIARFFAIPLWQRTAAGFALGILAGLIMGPAAEVWLQPIGDVYLNLIRMVVAPLVLFTIASSIAKLGEGVGAVRLGVRTIAWFAATSFLAVLVGLGFGHLFDPGVGLSNLPLGEVKDRVIPTPLDVLIGIVPTNPFAALSEGKVLQIIFFSALVGTALVALGDRAQGVRRLVDEGAAIIFRITRWVIQLTPFGVFGLIGSVVGGYGWEALLPLGKFILAIYAACLFHILVVYSGLLKLHGLKATSFFRGAFAAQQTAFATSSSLGTLPITLRQTVERLGVPQAYAAFAVPLGASVKMDGCGAIYPAIASIFIAQYFDIDLSLTQYVLIGLTAVLGSLGTAGVPGTSIVMLTLTLSTAGLPLEGIGYIVAIDRIIDMIRTATNVTGQMLVPVLVAREENILNQGIYDGHVAWLPGDPDAETPETVKAAGI